MGDVERKMKSFSWGIDVGRVIRCKRGGWVWRDWGGLMSYNA